MLMNATLLHPGPPHCHFSDERLVGVLVDGGSGVNVLVVAGSVVDVLVVAGSLVVGG